MLKCRTALSLGIALAAGCGGTVDNQVRDAGREAAVTDTGATDTGTIAVDAGPADTGIVPTDLGVADTGPADAGPAIVDSGPMDTGVIAMDTGPVDTGVMPVDAGPPDAGPPDAGPPDAGPPDAGPPDTGPPDTGPSCIAPQTLCGGQCVNTQTSTAHCGTCGNACTAPTNGTPTCTAGACGIACNTGFNLVGATCAPCGAVGQSACTTGSPCAAGLAACAGTCRATQTDIAHCGTCNTACTTSLPNAVPGCVAGRCEALCAPGFARVSGQCVAVRSPRPVGPLSTATVTSLRPLLRWNRDALSPPITGVRIELCGDPRCTDIRASTVVDRDTLEAVPESALEAGRHYWWRLRGRVGTDEASPTQASPIWQFRTHRSATAESQRRNSAWGEGNNDLNGDGYDDLAVGVPGEQRVVVLWGGADGYTSMRSTSLAVPTGADAPPAGATFGREVFIADTTRSGLARLYVAASQFGNDGAVYEYSANQGGTILTRTSRVLRSGLTGDQTRSFAWSGTTGDFNADGYADLAFGGCFLNSSYASLNERVWLSLGGPEGPGAFRVLTSTVATGCFGYRVGTAGDLNGDGYPELGVGSSLGPGGAGGTGRMTYYPGRADGVGSEAVHGSPGSFSRPYGMTGGCDFNGDGYADAIEEWSNYTTGFGGNAVFGLRAGSSAFPSMLLPFGAQQTHAVTEPIGLMSQRSACFDADGDGRADFFGAFFRPGVSGYFVFGAPGDASLGLREGTRYTFPARGTGHGAVVVNAGDANGDGYADLAMTEYLPSTRRTDVLMYYGRAGTGAGAFAPAAVVLPGLTTPDPYYDHYVKLD
jgi:hypothetical protein